MKKVIYSLIIVMFILMFNIVSYASISYIVDNKTNTYTGKDVTIKLNDEKIKTDIPPIIHNDRTLIPIRALIEKLDGKVGWNEKERKVTISLKENNIEMKIGEKTAKVNNKEVQLDVAPCIAYEGNDQSTGRTVVPIRFVMENLGLDVDWDNKTYTVLVKTKSDETYTYTNNITNVQYSVSQDKITIRITTENKMKYTISDLKNDYRTVIDIQDSSFTCNKNDISIDTGNINKIRMGQGDKYARVVIDLYDEEKYNVSLNQSENILTIEYDYVEKNIEKIEIDTSSKNKAIINIDGSNISKYDVRRLTNPERIQLTIYDMNVKTKDILKNTSIDNKYINKIESNNNDGDVQIIVYLNSQYQYSFSKTSSRGVIQIYSSELSNFKYENNGQYNLQIDLSKNINKENLDYTHDRSNKIFTLKLAKNCAKIGQGDLKIGDDYIEKINVSEDDDYYIIKINLYKSCDFIVNVENNKLSIKLVKRDPSRNIIIVVDPGHVGKGSIGAAYGGVIERTINTAVGEKLIAMLKKLDGVEVYTTLGLNYETLYDATGYANDLDADLFISIHCNAAVSATGEPLESATGTETYYALKEGDSEYGITSQQLAKYIQTELVKSIGSKDRGVIRRDTLAVLRTSKMPAMLTELGFMSSTEELEKLTNEEYQDKCAKGIYNGIVKAIKYMKG